MLGKCLKYDLRSSGKLILPLSLIAVLVSAFGCAVIAFLEWFSNLYTDENVVTVLVYTLGTMFIFTAAIVGIVGFPICTTVVIVHRFYTSCYTDEGYLTFTLPVTTHKLLISKTLSGFIWSIYSAVISVICIGGYILTCIGLFSSAVEIRTLFDEVVDMIFDQYGLSFAANAVSYIVSMLASSLFGILVLYLSFTIGAMLTKKYKALAGIAIYFAINVVASTVQSIGSVFTSIGFGAAESSLINSGWYLNITLWVSTVITAALSVGAYYLMHYIFKNKLNLR